MAHNLFIGMTTMGIIIELAYHNRFASRTEPISFRVSIL